MNLFIYLTECSVCIFQDHPNSVAILLFVAKYTLFNQYLSYFLCNLFVIYTIFVIYSLNLISIYFMSYRSDAQHLQKYTIATYC